MLRRLVGVYTPTRPLSRPITEDRRTYHPERANRPALRMSGLPAQVKVGSRPRRSPQASSRAMTFPSNVIAFQNPEVVVTCVRRKTRREVLFAKGGAGGGKKIRRPKWTWRSRISCKR